jgi:hypothetical protein
VRSVADIAKAAGSGIAFGDDDIGKTFVRGQLSGSSVTFINGVKVIVSTNLPKSAIEEVSITTNDYYEDDSYYPNYKVRNDKREVRLQPFENIIFRKV